MRRGRSGGIAVLPMYDRPELRAETDLLWSMLREAIRDRGMDAPDTLSRNRPNRIAWAAPELVIGQTCGLPFVKALRGRVGLVGTPSYALEGCAPGQYRSALIVRDDAEIETIADLRGKRPAINARDSQSGYAALMVVATPFANPAGFFGEPVATGAHQTSIEAVASGRADVAAIDAVSFALSQRYDAAAARVRVISWSEPTPGLPFITGRKPNVPTLATATAEAIGGLSAPHRASLLMTGFVRTRPEDYDVIRDRLRLAERRHALPSPQHIA